MPTEPQRKRKVYVASSWGNPLYPKVVEALRLAGHEVYDFRDANRAFSWAQIDPSWDSANPVLTGDQLLRALASPEAARAFAHDKGGLDWADTGVVVMPCGRSAHIEAGYLIGRGVPVHFVLVDGERPDLMHLLAGLSNLHVDVSSVVEVLR